MYKKILVPLDGSKLAETALPHAESLAVQYNATLILLAVISPPTITTGLGTETTTGPGTETLKLYETEFNVLRRDTEQYLQILSNKLSKRNIQTQTAVRLEPVVGSIVAQANESAVDLVVIASHGRSGLGRFFFGSVAAGVLNRIEQPLMIIRCAEK